MIARKKIRSEGRAEDCCDQVIFTSTQYAGSDDEGAQPSKKDKWMQASTTPNIRVSSHTAAGTRMEKCLNSSSAR
jgi:hypothetical protein